jgi:hypothetical protein
LLTTATEVLTYLPRQAWQGIFAAKAPQSDPDTTLRQTAPALDNAAGFETSSCETETAHKFPNMVVARRYGHQ